MKTILLLLGSIAAIAAIYILGVLAIETLIRVSPPRNTRGGRLGKFLFLSGAVRRI